MEQQPQKLRSFFSKFAGSLMVKADNDLNIRCFTKKQIRTITDNYSTELGKGGFSLVYKGRLDDGRPVAVKKYIFTSKKKEFTKEVIIQSQFSHRNIVKLLGCCVEADAPMLVTEFVPNGNLSDLLHGMNAHRAPLSLCRRLQIASDVAEALVYMHTSQSHPILHGDIKPDNIFLDKNYVAKLSDFGISRLLSMSSDEYTGYVIGSMGYVDPEFCQTGRLDTKSDVYSFGVVLLELVTRRKAIDENNKFLAKFFSRDNTKFTRHEILDTEIATTENMEVLDDIVNLALECVKFELEERPEMRDVSECLRKIQRIQGEKHRQEVISSLQKSGCIRFTTKDQINKMTDNFESIPTECFMGKIYKGNYKEMPLAVIKASFEIHSKLQEKFCNQIVLHAKVNHNNVVKFEGCCLDGDVPILVYECAKASLHDILFGDGSKNWTIDFEVRLLLRFQLLKVLITCIHLIKVSGIGASMYLAMSKAAHERIKAEENNGYMDPRFLESGVLAKEADVYTFGVVLLEFFTGKKASNHIKHYRLEELIWDSAACYHLEKPRRMIFQCLDPDVRRRPKLEEAIRVFTSIITEDLFNDRMDDYYCNERCAARRRK
ncbi:hypothetical protein ACP70R_048774 [Stipagrostis hirtigluma subsp. patula]